MIRRHLGHVRSTVDDQSIAIRFVITAAALASLPLLGTGVRALGSALGLDWITLPLLVVAHLPVAIALIALWSIGCDVCRSG